MRISHLLLSSLMIVGASTSAFAGTTVAAAQDNAQTSAPPPAPDNSNYSWSGAYVGLNVGDAFDSRTRTYATTGEQSNNTASLANGLRPTHHSIHDSGVTAGGQLGYNAQVGAFNSDGLALVLGAEADLAYTDLHQTDTLSNTSNLGPLNTPTTTSYTRVNQYHSNLEYLGTVRGRIGVASRRMMVYGTAGFAYGRVQRDAVFYGPNAPSTPYFAGSSSGTKTGYVYGGGVEYALPTGSFLSRLMPFHTSAVTLKAEFLRYDLGNDTLVMPGVNGGATIGGYTSRVHTEGDIARAGINYKF